LIGSIPRRLRSSATLEPVSDRIVQHIRSFRMNRDHVWRLALAGLITSQSFVATEAGERIERFNRDPGWEGRNHYSTGFPARTLRQDFGFSPTHHAGGQAPGEMGGLLTPAAEPAYYARVIPNKTFADRLSASGVLACGAG